MKTRLSSVCILVVGLALALTWAVSAQQQQPASGGAPSRDGLGVRATSAITLGQPGLSYRYVQTFGISQIAYISDTAHINHPGSLYVDSDDNVLITDGSFRVLEYNPSGQNVLVIGKAGLMDTSKTTFWRLRDISKDSNGYIWVNDYCRLVQFDANGAFQQSFPAEDNRPWECGSDNERLSDVVGLVITDTLMFASDFGNHRIQVFYIDGTSLPSYINTIGVTGETGSDNTHFSHPAGIAVDRGGRLYVIDADNQRLQRCESPDNWINWTCSLYRSNSEGIGGIWIDANDNVYLADNPHNQLLKIDRFGNETVVVNSLNTWAGDIAVDSNGNIYVADWPGSTIRKYDSAGVFVSIFAGVENEPYLTTSPYLNRPYGITVATDGSLYIGENGGDAGGYRLIKMDSAGNYVWTVGSPGNWGDDNQHFGSYWIGLSGNPTVSGNGKVYVADQANNRVQIYSTSDGSYVDTIGSYGQGNNQFNEPMGVAINPTNNDILVVDSANHRIQIFTSGWVYKATIGETGVSGSDNQHFNHPQGVAIANDGTVFVADSDNTRVQKCVSVSLANYSCSTFAGMPGEGGDDFSHLYPKSVAVDSQGRVFATDWDNRRVQVFDPDGAYLTTIGGTWGITTGRFRWVGGIAVDSQGSLYVADDINHRVQKYSFGVPEWQQVNVNGFGERWSGGIIALEVFKNQLYASEANWNQGARIWRSANGVDWTAVTEPGFGNAYGSANPAVPDMIVFNSYLYAGTGWAGNPLQIWRTSSGVNWEQVEDSGFGVPENTAVEAFEVFNDQIYASVQNTSTGAQIWRSSNGDSGSWEKVKEGFNGDINSYRGTGMAVYNNKLYVAIENDFTGTEIWETPDGSRWFQVNTDGFGTANNWVQGGPVVYKGELYIGTNNLVAGGQVWKYNGTTWSQVIANGFGDNTNLESLVVFGEELYVGTGNTITGMEIWRLSGNLPQQVSLDGFGDSNNESSLWCNAQAVFNGHLYIGTWNWANGGELWRFSKGYFAVYLPLVVR